MPNQPIDEVESTEIAGYVEFEFDLPNALLNRLVRVFQELESANLNAFQVQEIPDEQGVYQLFLDGVLVYVGKTDGDAGLRSRLTRHATKMLQRSGLDPSRVTYKAVRVYVFTAMDLEGDLIKYYGGVSALAWNGSGFGSNDPGKERDTTKVKADNFDALFPVDIDIPLNVTIGKGDTAADVAARLKGFLPYTLRYQNLGGNSRKPHKDLTAAKVGALAAPVTARAVVSHIISFLPRGWHATVLPGYIIMYKNDRRKFPSGQLIAKSP